MAEVSVIIPVYNVEKYLVECLDSVRNQSFSDIEIICIDDGSTDGSRQILEQYRMKDCRFKVLSTSNQGVSAARNQGVRIANGKYIYFVDADDYIAAYAIEEMYKKAEIEKLDILAVDIAAFCDDAEYKEYVEQSGNHYRIKGTYEGAVSGIELMKAFVDNHCYRSVVYGLFYSKAFLDQYNMSFKPGICYEDVEYVYRAFVYAQRAAVLYREIYYRRFRRDSIMTSEITSYNSACLFKVYFDLKRFILEKEIFKEGKDAWKYMVYLKRRCGDCFRNLSPEEKEKMLQSLTKEELFLFQEEFLTDDELETDNRPINEIKQELTELKKDRRSVGKEIEKLQKDLDYQEKVLMGKEKEREQEEKRYHLLKSSTTYKVGNAVFKHCFPWLKML